ncbi:hypothetical protein TNCV_2310641 [Trichonephila clavipes]|nr:hypothetical protein TNCV_2310641 [Trichonephila clavipes]
MTCYLLGKQHNRCKNIRSAHPTSGCGSPVVKVLDHGRHVMSSSPVPLRTRRVGQRCTLNLSRAETSSRWMTVMDEDTHCNEPMGEIRIGLKRLKPQQPSYANVYLEKPRVSKTLWIKWIRSVAAKQRLGKPPITPDTVQHVEDGVTRSSFSSRFIIKPCSWLEIYENLQSPKTPKSISDIVPYRFVTRSLSSSCLARRQLLVTQLLPTSRYVVVILGATVEK